MDTGFGSPNSVDFFGSSQSCMLIAPPVGCPLMMNVSAFWSFMVGPDTRLVRSLCCSKGGKRFFFANHDGGGDNYKMLIMTFIFISW